MLGRIVKRDCPIVVHTALRDVTRIKQGSAHVAMPDHERSRGALFLRKREEMGREIETDIAVECQSVRGPEAVEDRERQQWVFGPFRGYSRRTGKSPLDRECVVADAVVVKPVSHSPIPC
jgi:hypothetical protein